MYAWMFAPNSASVTQMRADTEVWLWRWRRRAAAAATAAIYSAADVIITDIITIITRNWLWILWQVPLYDRLFRT